MANIDNPRGLRAVKHLNGGKVPCHKYTSGTTAVFAGDVVVKKASGYVVSETVTTGTDLICGVAQNYVAAGTNSDLWVYDDPYTIFAVNSDGTTDPGSTTAQGHIGNTAGLALGSGSTTTGNSAFELDYSTISTGTGGEALKIVAHEQRANNDVTLAHADYLVMFQRHLYKDKGHSV